MLRTAMASICVTLMLFPTFSQARYFTFDESQAQALGWNDPSEMMASLARTAIDLLAWIDHSSKRPEPSEKYNRLEHFGTWVNDPRTPDCLDTRAVVLVRDSEQDVSMSSGNPCRVYSGRWTDPYSSQVYKMARDMQIDHVVALKNAYVSGAYQWDYKHRCLYGNFLGYKNHLLAASGAENSAKGDLGPESWMPSEPEYACQHLQNWLVVKLTWRLNMSVEEAQAIVDEARRNRCDSRYFQISKYEIQKVRRYALQNLELCMH